MSSGTSRVGPLGSRPWRRWSARTWYNRARCAPRRSARPSCAPRPSARTTSPCARRATAPRSPGASTASASSGSPPGWRAPAGLAGLGVQRGDGVALMLLNRPEFHLVDTAALLLGATPFSIYNTSTAEQIDHLFTNAANRVVVTEQAFVPVIGEARRRVPGIEHVVVVDHDEYGALTLAELEEKGSSSFDFMRTAAAVEPNDVATLIYTSGTTGPPKGVQLTHANLMDECRAVATRLPTAVGGHGVSFLPSAHIADRWGSHYFLSMMYGGTITSIPDPRTVAIHLPDARPTGWGAVPRTWEKLKAALEA